MAPRPFLTPAEAARRTGVEEEVIQRAARSGALASYRLTDRCVRFSDGDLAEWVDLGKPAGAWLAEPPREPESKPRRGRAPVPPEERFWAKVHKTDTCWVWVAARNPGGYGQFRVSHPVRRTALAHRFAYELLVGPIPAGLQIDHLCRNRGCVNPAHLEVVTRRENYLRGTSPAAFQARQTHCKHGHPLTGENVYSRPSSPNRRECRACKYEANRQIRERAKREAA